MIRRDVTIHKREQLFVSLDGEGLPATVRLQYFEC